MKINDIDFDLYQKLVDKANAFDAGILDTAKFIRIDYGFYIARTEYDLIQQFQTISDRANYYQSAIHGYCSKNNVNFTDFVEKYGVKK